MMPDIASSSSWIVFSSLLVFAYALGAVCAAIVVCKALNLADPRTLGSGNPGASNVLRNHGKFPALLTFSGDLIKGIIPMLLGMACDLSTQQIGWIGFAACVGHMYPIYYRFEGGKGVATAFGVLHLVYWPVALLADAAWLITMKLTKTASIASLTAWTLAPLILFILHNPTAWPMLCLSLLIWWRHKENMQRLIKGQELKVR